MKLYEVSLSPNCKKVRVCAQELGIPLELIPVNPMNGENRKPEYLAKNPMGKVPTLDDDGKIVWESGAILAYLASKRPEKGLLPTDTAANVETMRWMLWYTCHLQPYLAMLAMERRVKPLMGQPGNDPHIIKLAEGEVNRFLPVLNGQLEGRDYLVGRYTIADIAVGCSLEAAEFSGVDLAPYPHIRAWVSRLQAREAWQKAKAPDSAMLGRK